MARAQAALLHAIRAWDGLRLARLRSRHPGLEIDPAASTNLAAARFVLAPGARLRLAAGVVTERMPGRLHFHVEPGASVDVGEGTWLRTEVGEVHLIAFAGAELRIGADSFLNGAYLSAKREVSLGRRVFVGPGSRVFDADQHDLDSETPERSEPVRIGDCTWIAADCTLLRGVIVGEHAVVGARSVVTRDVPPHTLVAGSPAEPIGVVGDRSSAR